MRPLSFVLSPVSFVARECRQGQGTRDQGQKLWLAAAIPGAHPGQEPPLLVGQRLDAFLLHLGEQVVHPPLLRLAGFLLPLGLAEGPLLSPPLVPVRPLPLRGRRRLLLAAFQAGVTLREVVAE